VVVRSDDGCETESVCVARDGRRLHSDGTWLHHLWKQGQAPINRNLILRPLLWSSCFSVRAAIEKLKPFKMYFNLWSWCNKEHSICFDRIPKV
jgi:hypothetical protein